jgi:hypothetical protein
MPILLNAGALFSQSVGSKKNRQVFGAWRFWDLFELRVFYAQPSSAACPNQAKKPKNA